ncbi:MAG: hypothetical protein M3Q81_00035 [bacterium]|nr:hypothetical protein [bacterium]
MNKQRLVSGVRLTIFFLLFGTVTLTATQSVFAQALVPGAATSSPQPSTLAPTITPSVSGSLKLTVSPITIVLETEPGVPVTSTIKVRNNGSENEYIQASLSKFQADPSGEKPQILDFTAEEEYSKWITFKEPSFVIRPGEWKTIEFTFAPPKAAALNYFYVLVFERQLNANAQDGESVLSGAPGILVLANVLSPNSKRELQLESFSVPWLFIEFLPVEFVMKVKNTGNTFLAPVGNIFIDGNGKKDVAVLSANPNSSNILPQTEREYRSSWTDGFPLYSIDEENGEPLRDDNGELKYSLKWDFSQVDKFRIGRYTANLLLVYDDGQRDVPLESSVSFWVIPWRVLAASIVLLILTLLGLKATIAPVIKKIFRR